MILPLLCPHVACVGVAVAVTAVEVLSTTEAVAEQPAAVSVTVTLYVPAVKLVGLKPVMLPLFHV